MNEGHIFIDDIITPSMLTEVKSLLRNYADRESIVLHIQSPGGSVYAGYNIYHAIKAFGKPVKAIIEGEAQSMATFIALAADTVEICNPSVFMIHNPHNELQGTAESFEQGASELRNIENDMVAAYVAKTKLPETQVRDMMRKETSMTAEQARTYGFVDKVLPNYMKAVALGLTTKKKMSTENKFKKILINVAKALATATGTPVDQDVKTSDGKMITISEDGSTAIIDGQPATGTFTLEDGKTVTVQDGKILSWTEPEMKPEPTQQAPAPVVTPAPEPAPAPTPAPAPIQAVEQQLAAAQQQIATLTAQKEAAEAKVVEGVTALATFKTELEAEMSKTVGDDNAPNKGLIVNKKPAAQGTPISAAQKDRTMSYLMEHLPWLQDFYGRDKVAQYITGPKAVSILETSFNYTYPGILTTDIFFKPSLGNPSLNDLFTVDPGIKSHKQYNLVNPISKILKPYTGCDRVFNNSRAFITNTTVRVKEFQVNESWCKDDFTGYLTGGFNYLAQEWLKTGIDSFDPSGTPIERVIDTVLYNALRLDVFRRVSFAAGNSSDDDYNQFDGLWDRLIDSSGGSNYCVVRAQANPGVATGFGTGALAAGAALTALESVYASSNILLRDWNNIYAQFSGAVSKPVFWVTRSIWDNYYNSLIGTGAVTEQAFENLQKGLTTLTYKGYDVRPVSLWDQFLAESDNPLTAITRHLILFTTKDNHILGVEQGSDLNKLEGWYERKDRKFYYEADMKMGYNYMHCDLQTIAY